MHDASRTRYQRNSSRAKKGFFYTSKNVGWHEKRKCRQTPPFFFDRQKSRHLKTISPSFGINIHGNPLPICIHRKYSTGNCTRTKARGSLSIFGVCRGDLCKVESQKTRTLITVSTLHSSETDLRRPYRLHIACANIVHLTITFGKDARPFRPASTAGTGRSTVRYNM